MRRAIHTTRDDIFALQESREAVLTTLGSPPPDIRNYRFIIERYVLRLAINYSNNILYVQLLSIEEEFRSRVFRRFQCYDSTIRLEAMRCRF